MRDLGSHAETPPVPSHVKKLIHTSYETEPVLVTRRYKDTRQKSMTSLMYVMSVKIYCVKRADDMWDSQCLMWHWWVMNHGYFM